MSGYYKKYLGNVSILLTSHPQSKMILLNNNHYQAVVYFLLLKADFTLQQIKSFEKSRVMVDKFNQSWFWIRLAKVS